MFVSNVLDPGGIGGIKVYRTIIYVCSGQENTKHRVLYVLLAYGVDTSLLPCKFIFTNVMRYSCCLNFFFKVGYNSKSFFKKTKKKFVCFDQSGRL